MQIIPLSIPLYAYIYPFMYTRIQHQHPFSSGEGLIKQSSNNNHTPSSQLQDRLRPQLPRLAQFRVQATNTSRAEHRPVRSRYLGHRPQHEPQRCDGVSLVGVAGLRMMYLHITLSTQHLEHQGHHRRVYTAQRGGQSWFRC